MSMLGQLGFTVFGAQPAGLSTPSLLGGNAPFATELHKGDFTTRFKRKKLAGRVASSMAVTALALPYRPGLGGPTRSPVQRAAARSIPMTRTGA